VADELLKLGKKQIQHEKKTELHDEKRHEKKPVDKPFRCHDRHKHSKRIRGWNIFQSLARNDT